MTSALAEFAIGLVELLETEGHRAQARVMGLLACLVALAIALPSLGVAAAGVAVSVVGASQAATCDCPLARDADCPERSADCSPGAACLARCAVTAPSLAAVSPVHVVAAISHADWRAERSTAPPDVPAGPPFRPPRTTIPT